MSFSGTDTAFVPGVVVTWHANESIAAFVSTLQLAAVTRRPLRVELHDGGEVQHWLLTGVTTQGITGICLRSHALGWLTAPSPESVSDAWLPRARVAACSFVTEHVGTARNRFIASRRAA